MGLEGVIIVSAISLILVVPVAAFWLMAWATWRDARTPPMPYDASGLLHRVARPWGEPPVTVAEWVGTDTPVTTDSATDVEVATVLSVHGNTTGDDEAHTRLRLRLPDGTETVVHAAVSDADHVAPGTFLPVRPMDERFSHVLGDTLRLAANLPTEDTHRLLLQHRRRLGLLDDDGYNVLIGGRAQVERLVAVRPTGKVRAGHVEVDATVHLDDAAQSDVVDVRGYLRPQELITARLSRRIPVARSTQGQWALVPTWY